MGHPANLGKVEGREAEVLNGRRLFGSVERGSGKRGFPMSMPPWIMEGGIVITDAEVRFHLMSYVFFWGLIVKDDELELNRGYSKKEEIR